MLCNEGVCVSCSVRSARGRRPRWLSSSTYSWFCRFGHVTARCLTLLLQFLKNKKCNNKKKPWGEMFLYNEFSGQDVFFFSLPFQWQSWGTFFLLINWYFLFFHRHFSLASLWWWSVDHLLTAAKIIKAIWV